MNSSNATPAAAPRLLVAIATYNEIENLPALTAEILATVPNADLLVIDDNSPDGTGKWVDSQLAHEPRLRVIHRSGKLGLGTAVIAGMKYAIEHDYDWLQVMDADFSHHPRYLPAIHAAMANTDVSIGSRYVPGGGVQNWPLLRRLMSRTINLYSRCLLGLPIRDSSGFYRCFRVEMLKQLDFSTIVSRGYSFGQEVLWQLKRRGARFHETPIIFADREKGRSKINLREAINAVRIIFRLGVKNWLGV